LQHRSSALPHHIGVAWENRGFRKARCVASDPPSRSVRV